MVRKFRIPKYRKHSSGQARVTLNQKDHLLGPYNSPESHEAYKRLIAEWLEQKGSFDGKNDPEPEPISINELLVAYWQFAETYYGFDDPKRGRNKYRLQDALRVVKELYGSTAAVDFGPLALKACRSQMIDKGWCRTYINEQVNRIRRVFKWAASEELLPNAVYQNLCSVEGLRAGRTKARESTDVKPVPEDDFQAALPFMPAMVAAMARFQRLTGCRPVEVCSLRPVDLDMTNPECWVYQLVQHKTQYLGKQRYILIGPRAQDILRPFLATTIEEYCFSPRESEAQRNANRKNKRNSPMTASQRKRSAKKSKRKHPLGDSYPVTSYRNAIYRACDRAGVPRWSPNRLRHNRATELRTYGLDLAKTILGHTKVETTQLYAEKDLQAAIALVSQIG